MNLEQAYETLVGEINRNKELSAQYNSLKQDLDRTIAQYKNTPHSQTRELSEPEFDKWRAAYAETVYKLANLLRLENAGFQYVAERYVKLPGEWVNQEGGE